MENWFLIFGVHVVVLFFGECAIVFQSKTCVTNPMSILYISPMTDKKTTHHNIGVMEKKMETTV